MVRCMSTGVYSSTRRSLMRTRARAKEPTQLEVERNRFTGTQRSLDYHDFYSKWTPRAVVELVEAAFRSNF